MNYIALTIGPIYKTLSSAKKTRDLWGGSYLFSHIIKNIILAFRDREFIVPYQDDTIFQKHQGVGLFHDRFIFKSIEGDKEKLENVIAKVLSSLAKAMHLNETFLKNYLQISFIEKTLDEDKNPILELTPYLDTQELFFKVTQYDKNLLLETLQSNNSFLKKEAFGENRGFPTLPEIALHDIMDNTLRNNIVKQEDELSVYEDKALQKQYNFKRYHKYIAIVHADGDNMSEVIQNLTSTEDFSNFSKKLFEYGLASHESIKVYGGETIFAGGDDLLFFAPVVNGNSTIFNLIDEISKKFDTLFKKENQKITNNGKQATLSFGVSITYHKFPLYEALEKSRHLLFSQAKSGKKNNIAFSIIKHSGQGFGGIVPKNNEVYKQFLALTSNIMGNDEGVDNFLHSLHHKIDTYKIVFNQIANNQTKLTNFFNNYFNEEEHKQYQAFFEQLILFINELYHDETIKNKLALIYATLRFVKFIKGDK